MGDGDAWTRHASRLGVGDETSYTEKQQKGEAFVVADADQRKQRRIPRDDLDAENELRLVELGTEEGETAGGPRLDAG
jgi:hypothetical protein